MSAEDLVSSTDILVYVIIKQNIIKHHVADLVECSLNPFLIRSCILICQTAWPWQQIGLTSTLICECEMVDGEGVAMDAE
jgi:hypothetical protein